jgi:hypothetical protein
MDGSKIGLQRGRGGGGVSNFRDFFSNWRVMSAHEAPGVETNSAVDVSGIPDLPMNSVRQVSLIKCKR